MLQFQLLMDGNNGCSFINRDHRFQTSANFQDFGPYHPPVGSLLLLSIRWVIWPIFDLFSPKNYRRLKWMVPQLHNDRKKNLIHLQSHLRNTTTHVTISEPRKIIYPTHGLRTPNEGINQRNMKIQANVADKIYFGRTKKFVSRS